MIETSLPLAPDPPHVPAKRRPAPFERNRGGQPGHRWAFRRLLPAEPVDAVVEVVPVVCRPSEQPLAEIAGRRGRVWRHQPERALRPAD